MYKIASRDDVLFITCFVAIFIAGVGFVFLSFFGSNTEETIPIKKEAVVYETFSSRFDHSAISPIPRAIVIDSAKVQLGRRLFHEKQLSKTGNTSCVYCHHLAGNGTDENKRYSTRDDGTLASVNGLSIFNSVFNRPLFWDGRATTLQEQILDALQKEMGMTWPEVATVLQQDESYRLGFKKIYSEGLTKASFLDAIIAFEKTLVTPDSRFDQFLKGNAAALSQKEREGFNLFKSYGCIACHQGRNIGGNLLQKFGIMGSPFTDREALTLADYGFYNVSDDDNDRFVFRVPSLRNVALTAPYFHDGSAKTLHDAVEAMLKYQVGREASDDEEYKIVAFLKTLTGNYIGLPDLPDEG